MSDFSSRLWTAVSERWREDSARHNGWSATVGILRESWGFLRDSTPQRHRSRYGDMEYDWEHRVNTTSGSVRWRERLLGVFHSPYQPTDAALFRDMMASLPIDFSQFTFIDLGSGKGRTLLMASEYPFRRIVGVEILPELDRAAQENIRLLVSPEQRCTQLESICADAREFNLPEEPLLLYLFNPLPLAGLTQVLAQLEASLRTKPRPIYVVYHNPLLENCLQQCVWLERIVAGSQFVIYRKRVEQWPSAVTSI